MWSKLSTLQRGKSKETHAMFSWLHTPHHHHHFPLTLKAEASGPLTDVVQNMPKGRAGGVDAISSGMSHHVTIVTYSFSSNLVTWNSQSCLVPPGWLSLLSSVLIICSKFWIPESLQITSCSDLDPLQSTSSWNYSLFQPFSSRLEKGFRAIFRLLYLHKCTAQAWKKLERQKGLPEKTTKRETRFCTFTYRLC